MKLRKVAKSLVVTLPEEILKTLNWREGDELQWIESGGALFLLPASTAPEKSTGHVLYRLLRYSGSLRFLQGSLRSRSVQGTRHISNGNKIQEAIVGDPFLDLEVKEK